jgi:hypothetical protein
MGEWGILNPWLGEEVRFWISSYEFVSYKL